MDGVDLHHLHPERHADGVAGQVDDVLALADARQVDAGPRRRPGPRRWMMPGDGAQPHLHRVHRLARQLEVLGEVLQLHGHARAPSPTSSRPAITNQSRTARARLTSFRGRFSSRRRMLTSSRRGRGLGRGAPAPPPAPPRPPGPRAAPASGRARRARGGCARPATSEMMPVSSETTTARASVSSVTPMAARWRLPSVARQLGVHGQGQEAGGGGHAVALDDHRAVVQRRAGLKMLISRS